MISASWGDGYDSYLDYVTGWFIKASLFPLFREAVVFSLRLHKLDRTGHPVPALFRPLLEGGWQSNSPQTFAWTSERAAAVHCVITRLRPGAPHEGTPINFTYSDKAQPEALPSTTPAPAWSRA